MGVQFKALGSLIASVLKNDKMEDEHLGRPVNWVLWPGQS